jgi:hypothetical protein
MGLALWQRFTAHYTPKHAVGSTKLKLPLACFPVNVWDVDQLLIPTLCACRLLPGIN